MLDIKNLSKIKHIYHYRTDRNGQIHCEKYPVVYINKRHTYIKIPSSYYLECIDTEYVYKDLDAAFHDDIDLFGHDKHLQRYFWNRGTNDQEIFDEYRKKVIQDDKDETVKEWLSELNKCDEKRAALIKKLKDLGMEDLIENE